jgi:ribosomal protein L37AE/L43A
LEILVTDPLTVPRKELQAPPPLNSRPPLCPMCGEEVQSDGDGGWSCCTCKAQWSGLDVGWEKGEWVEADILACPSMAKDAFVGLSGAAANTNGGWQWQCAKPLDHDGEHHSETGATWPNPWLIQSDAEGEK